MPLNLTVRIGINSKIKLVYYCKQSKKALIWIKGGSYWSPMLGNSYSSGQLAVVSNIEENGSFLESCYKYTEIIPTQGRFSKKMLKTCKDSIINHIPSIESFLYV